MSFSPDNFDYRFMAEEIKVMKKFLMVYLKNLIVQDISKMLVILLLIIVMLTTVLVGNLIMF